MSNRETTQTDISYINNTIHPSTVPISNVKCKQVSKLYRVLYNNRTGGGYVQIPTYNLIHKKRPRAPKLRPYD